MRPGSTDMRPVTALEIEMLKALRDAQKRLLGAGMLDIGNARDPVNAAIAKAEAA